MKINLVHLLPPWIILYFLGTSFLPESVRRLQFASLYLLAGLIVITQGKKILPFLLKDPFIIGLIGLTGFSYFWSVTPNITFAYFRTVIVQYILAGYVVLAYKPRQLLGYITKTLSITIAISLVYVFGLPSVGINRGFDGSHSWRGIFPHQSYFAAAAALLCISALYTFLFSKQEDNPSRWVGFMSVVLMGAGFLAVFYSNARTSLLGIMTSFSIVPFLYLHRIKGIRTRTRTFLILLYICIISIALIVLTREFILVDILGKSPDLTGRTVLWEHLMSKVTERPMGYGQGAFWHNLQLHRELAAVLDRRIPSNYNSHSGYFDCLIGLGYPGLCLLCLAILNVIRKNIILILHDEHLISRWNLQVIAFLLVATYSDSFISFWNPRGIGGFLFMLISLSSIRQFKKLAKGRNYRESIHFQRDVTRLRYLSRTN